MKLSGLYKKIENPLEKKGIFENIINCYHLSKDEANFNERTMSVISISNKANNKGPNTSEFFDRFNSLVFNDWRKSMLEPVNDSFLKNRGISRKGFEKVQKLLRRIKNAKTSDDVSVAVKTIRQEEDEEFVKAYEACHYFCMDEKWTYYDSALINVHQEERMACEHALYLNISSKDNILKVVTYFLEKCRKKGLIYNFKYNDDINKDDNIVIYSSTEKLGDYLLVLAEIKQEHPDINSCFFEPSILVGSISGIVGYGSEPVNGISCTNLRLKIMYESIDKSIRKWVKKNSDFRIKVGDEYLTVSDAFYKEMVNLLMDKIKYEDFEFPISLIVHGNIKLSAKKAIKNGFVQSLNISSHPITPRISFSKKIEFNELDLTRLIKRYALIIVDEDPSLLDAIKKEIEVRCIDLDIDYDKFCFDKKGLDNIRKYDAKQNTKCDADNEKIIDSIIECFADN